MRRNQLWLVIFGLILLNCLTVAFFLSKSKEASSTVVDNEKVATIGNHSISRQQWLSVLEERYGEDVLKDMIDQKVIEVMAKKYHISIPESDVEREFKMIQTTYSSSNQKKLVNGREWRNQIRNSLLLEEILTKDVVVSNSDMKNYYNHNKDLFDVPTAYHLSQIIVKTKNEAKTAEKELSHGSSFSALAMESSIDEFSANQGGDIGYITKDNEEYPQQYIDIAKNLKVGKWSQPLKVEKGYAIIELQKVIHGENYSYSQVKGQIRRQIAMEQMKTPATARTFWDDANVSWFYGSKK